MLLSQPGCTGSREHFTIPGSLFSPPPPIVQRPVSPGFNTSSYSSTSTAAPVTKYNRAQSPNTNVVVLPSGTSIHIKGR